MSAKGEVPEGRLGPPVSSPAVPEVPPPSGRDRPMAPDDAGLGAAPRPARLGQGSAQRRPNAATTADVGDSPGFRPSPATSSTVVVGRFGGAVVVTLHGDIDQAASVRLAGVLGDIIDGQGNLAVVVDLHDVGWIEGAGVDVLAAAAASIASHGGELLLGGPNGVVFDAVARAGLSPIEPGHRAVSPGRAPDGAAGRSARAAGTSRHRSAGNGAAG